MKMKINQIRQAVGAVILGVALLTGCDRGTTAAEVGQKTGAALDTAADKTVDVTGKALDKTGEALQKAGTAVGTAVENTGENMQK